MTEEAEDVRRRNIHEGIRAGDDLNADVALLKINPAGLTLTPLQLGTSAHLVVGSPVAAIGSPFGQDQSLSVGVISATGRDIDSLTSFKIGNAIQTDAAINHGNSGGPLLNLQGQVVGINSAGADSAQNIGFAIAIDSAKQVIQQAIDNPLAATGYIGVSTQTVNSAMAYQLSLKVDKGAYIIATSPGGPADKAGIQSGDVIVSVNGQDVASAEDLGSILGDLKPGDNVPIVIDRNGQQQTLTVTLGARPMPTQMP